MPRTAQQSPRLTIVTPVYNEEDNLESYAREVSATFFSRDDLDARVLFIDDGSTDRSWAKISELAAGSDRFTGLRLSRNFGAHPALAAGLDNVDASSDIVATLACDLQDPPQTVLDFVAAWRRGAQVVWGARRNRAEPGWRGMVSRGMETMLRRYAMPRNSRFTTGSFLLMDRRVLECFRQFREHSRVTFALVAWTGFEQAVVDYDRRARKHGRSGWTLGRMLDTGYDVFVGFSAIPAKILTWTGFATFGFSVVFMIYLVLYYLMHNVAPGWTGLMTATTLFFGIVFIMLGVMAEYLGRIFLEVKGRPLYFVAARTSELSPMQVGKVPAYVE
jgi:glycosyltransferase involved in cell wall biosynthesis